MHQYIKSSISPELQHGIRGFLFSRDSHNLRSSSRPLSNPVPPKASRTQKGVIMSMVLDALDAAAAANAAVTVTAGCIDVVEQN
ncbi:hypothetical protein DAPPUDRAFT_250786 [Daphnia pulex]|uniref:Uncharacterized protein n=1 Tax=Daphnia pulex TaxID=6669 RepID=E9GZA1_DAPPU|nr:hypothetical protein DAPPUDRAFT_250786 [Daphnia pulex]|eukprot:EFX75112.1 hypothetical protein DAPPUDRAFT_250786 [Daphnia pulex]